MTTLRESLQAKDAELVNAQHAGSVELQKLRAARQDLACNMEIAQEQLQVTLGLLGQQQSASQMLPLVKQR